MTHPYDDVSLPQTIEAEEAVLGSMLIDPRAVPRVTPILASDDFYLQKHGWVFRAVLDLRQRHDPVDYVTICDELERRDRLEAIGGAAYITRLINAVPSAVHAEAYARRVHETAVRRRVLRATSQAAQLAYQQDLPLDQVLDQIETAFLRLRGQVAFEERLRPMSAVMEEVLTQLRENE
jgi:replicative DNA helicase